MGYLKSVTSVGKKNCGDASSQKKEEDDKKVFWGSFDAGLVAGVSERSSPLSRRTVKKKV